MYDNLLIFIFIIAIPIAMIVIIVYNFTKKIWEKRAKKI